MRANPPSHAESIAPFAPKSTSIFLVINHKKKLDTYPRDVLGRAACQDRKSVEISIAYAQGGGNETHSHLARPRTPSRTTWGIFKPKKNNA